MAELQQRRLDVALLNHPGAVGVVGDLTNTWLEVVEQYRQAHGDEPPALLTACPPCQGMSSARSGKGTHADAAAGSSDRRNLLVTVIEQVALELKPRAIVVENVQAFLSRRVVSPEDDKPITAAQLLISGLADDYVAFPLTADLANYGVPQTRRRAFLTFLRKEDVSASNLPPGTYPFPRRASEPALSVVAALRSFALSSLDAGSKEVAEDPILGKMHSVPVWSPDRYRMVKAIPPGGSAWTNSSCESCGTVNEDLTVATCANCGNRLLRPSVVDPDGSVRLVRGFRTSYSRMRVDQPAPTVTTASGHVGSDLTIHPTENRVLSPLECAMLQTFPSDFRWGEALKRYGHTFVREIIGEAVPPHFTALHGKVIAALLTGDTGVACAPASDSHTAERLIRAAALADGRSAT